MSFMSAIFGGAAPSAPAPATSGTPPATPDPDNKTVPGATDIPPVIKKEESPLDSFKDIWKTPDPSTNKQEPLFAFDQAKLNEAVGKMDFLNGVPEEVLAKAAAGGQEGMAAVMQIVNMSNQATLSQTIPLTTKLIEQAVEKTRQEFAASIPELLRKQQVSSKMKDENPLFNHSAVKPILEAVQSQLVKNDPDATPEQIAARAKSYMQEVFKLANPETPQPKENNSKDEDWSSFFS